MDSNTNKITPVAITEDGKILFDVEILNTDFPLDVENWSHIDWINFECYQDILCKENKKGDKLSLKVVVPVNRDIKYIVNRIANDLYKSYIKMMADKNMYVGIDEGVVPTTSGATESTTNSVGLSKEKFEELSENAKDFKRMVDSGLKKDNVNHPEHYGGKDNVYEVIKIIEHYVLGFNLGNTLKYMLRAGRKDPSKYLEDLEKARFYLDREIELIKK